MNIHLLTRLTILFLFISTNASALNKLNNLVPNFGSRIGRPMGTTIKPKLVVPRLSARFTVGKTKNSHIIRLPNRPPADRLEVARNNCEGQTTDRLDAPLIIYMAMDGASGNTGLSSCEPVATLVGAQEAIEQQLEYEHRNVEVRIAPGTYRDQRVEWDYTMPNNTITFRPRDKGTRPIFDGSGLKEYADTKNKEWFKLAHAEGEKTNIVIDGLQIQNYGMAIWLYSWKDYDPLLANSHNTIRNNIFKDVGNFTTAAIMVQNSMYNLIEGNYFLHIKRGGNCGGLHVIYIEHLSSNNRVRGNVFEDTCSSSTIRVKNASNGNRIEDNTFIRASTETYIEDWYCDPKRGEKECTTRRPDPNSSNLYDKVLFAPECPSKDNVFSQNRLAGGSSGRRIKEYIVNYYSVAEECEAVPRIRRIVARDNKPEPRYLSNGFRYFPSLQVATARVFPSAYSALAGHVTTRLNGEFPASAHWVTGDFDGDGLDDVAVIRNQAGKSAVRVFPSNGNGISLSALFDQDLPTSFSKKHRWRAGDFDGDGRDDLLQIYNRSGESALQTYSSLGSSFEKSAFMRTGVSFSNRHHWKVGNFDGDDYDDLVLVYNRWGKSAVFTYTSTGSTFVQTNYQRMGANFSETNLWRVGDFDGDERDDLVLVYQNGGKTSTFIYSSTGGSFVQIGFYRTGAFFSKDNRWLVGDMDNDGMDDLVLVYKRQGKASTFTFSSTGSSFEQTNFQRLGTGLWDSQIWAAGDFSGDLADDLVLVYGYN